MRGRPPLALRLRRLHRKVEKAELNLAGLRAQRTEEVTRLRAKGHTGDAIGRRLGVPGHIVRHWGRIRPPRSR